MKKIALLLMTLSLMSGGVLAMDNPEQRVTEVIKDYIQAKYPDFGREEIELTYKQSDRALAALRPYSDKAELKIVAVMPDFKPVGNVIFPVLVKEGENEERVLLRTRVAVWRPIVAAAEALKRGEALAADKLKLERRDIALLPPKYFTDPQPLVGQQARIGIPANSTLFEWMVGAPPMVNRGGQVQIVVTGPGITVKSKAEALEDGVLGQEIRVKRLDSGKTLKALVRSATEVEVPLQ